MRRPPIIDPRMYAMLPDLYPQIVTIINPDGDSVDEWGQPIKGEEVIFEGLECNVAPAGGDEVRNGSTSYGLHTHMITIPGLYDIQAGWFADVEDDGKYAILLSEQDSQRSQTRIRAEGREI